MFTGIIADLASVESIAALNPGIRLQLDLSCWPSPPAIGESISVNGCCLTVVANAGRVTAFDAGPETLLKTTLGGLQSGHRVHVERAMRADDRLGGHLVTGHVDTVAELTRRDDQADWSSMWFCLPRRFTPQLAPKGSVAVDGVSLTLVDVESDRFSVALIPHTLHATNLGELRLGDRVNIETDVLAKYVERQLAAHLPTARPSAPPT